MSRKFTGLVLLLCLYAVNTVFAQSDAKPQIVEVNKIWDVGNHNAFTDLIRFHDKWYCVFRESEAHVGGDGKLRVLESKDGNDWQSAALIAEEGIDLRDPKLSITSDGRLMIVAGGSVYHGTKKLQARQPRVLFSKDAHAWSAPQRVLKEGDWLWRVTWLNGRAYGASYDAGPTLEAPGSTNEWKLELYSSANGVNYDLVTGMKVPGRPNETTLRLLSTGEMMALVRRETGNRMGWIGVSKPPFRDWSWKEATAQIGGPNFIELPNGSLWAAGRTYVGGAKTSLGPLTKDDWKPVLTLPSGGDTSYPGMVWHDGLLWLSYYSSHEGRTSIYLAKIKLP